MQSEFPLGFVSWYVWRYGVVEQAMACCSCASLRGPSCAHSLSMCCMCACVPLSLPPACRRVLQPLVEQGYGVNLLLGGSKAKGFATSVRFHSR